jgi:TRAP-type transport system periplasmic protein
VWPDVVAGRIIEALGVGSDAQEVDEMDTRSGRLTTVVVSMLTVAFTVAACAAPPGRGVGSQQPSIVLSLANGNHDHEGLNAFADGVAAATGGTVTIEFEDAAHEGEAAYESAIIDDVAAGTYDLGWVAPRPWHGNGVTSFDALMAPFLVDSYALQRAVLEGDLEPEMLAGLDGTGLVGLGILPGPMRRVATAEGGFRAPGDLRGKVVGIQDSEIAALTFEALGGSTKAIPGGGALGAVDAVEQQLGSLVGNRYHEDLPHVTVDLALWPRPLILFANKARFEGLSVEQQTALRGATRQLIDSTTAAVESEDASAVTILCADGADLVVAGTGAAEALLTAVRPVYDELEKDAATAAMVKRITEMKAGIPAATSTTACPSQPASPAPQTAGGFPEGTYEARLSCDELEAYWADHPELPVEDRFPCPVVMGFTLKDNTWVENYGERWKFSFFGDHVQLGNFTLRWSWDGTQVTFSEIQGGEEGDEQAWTTQPFVKLDDPAAPVVGFPDGTYRAQISSQEMNAFWEDHDVPIDLREPCPCQHEFMLRDGVWTGGDGSLWEPSFFGDKLTLTDREGSFTLRWKFDPWLEEVTFLDVDAGGGAEETDLTTWFTAKPFDRQDP